MGNVLFGVFRANLLSFSFFFGVFKRVYKLVLSNVKKIWHFKSKNLSIGIVKANNCKFFCNCITVQFYM